MYAGWNLMLVVAVLCGQSVGFFWRFNSFTGVVSTDTPELEEPLDTNKRVAIIGMYWVALHHCFLVLLLGLT